MKLYTICKQCHITFNYTRRKSPVTFCSRKCWGLSRRGKPMFDRGDKPYTYSEIHKWLVRTYGKASKCENEHCTYPNPKRYEWSLKKGCQYIKDRNCFIQFCPSCHRKYDFSEEQRKKISAALYKRVVTAETRAKMSKSRKGKTLSEAIKKKMSDGQKKRWAIRKGNM